MEIVASHHQVYIELTALLNILFFCLFVGHRQSAFLLVSLVHDVSIVVVHGLGLQHQLGELGHDLTTEFLWQASAQVSVSCTSSTHALYLNGGIATWH